METDKAPCKHCDHETNALYCEKCRKVHPVERRLLAVSFLITAISVGVTFWTVCRQTPRAIERARQEAAAREHKLNGDWQAVAEERQKQINKLRAEAGIIVTDGRPHRLGSATDDECAEQFKNLVTADANLKAADDKIKGEMVEAETAIGSERFEINRLTSQLAIYETAIRDARAQPDNLAALRFLLSLAR